MAKVFKGMSQDKFLDSLVAATGLNGHELFDYIVERITESRKTVPAADSREIVLTTEGNKTLIEFAGNKSEIADYYKNLGGDEKIIRYMGGMSPYLICTHCATILNVEEFVWITPCQKIGAGGRTYYSVAKYGVVWDAAEGIYKNKVFYED